MIIIESSEIDALDICPVRWMEWVREAFLLKRECILPPKISLHPRGNDFFNTMPCILPESYHTFGCKIVSRVKGTKPALKSELMLFDTLSGEMTALVNADIITAMRTGAVAALAINELRRKDASVYSFIGLGVIARATLDCLLSSNTDRTMTIRLMRYKDQAERIIDEYALRYPFAKFEICDSIAQFVEDSDVIVSCITDAEGLMVEDTEMFKPGVLVVPVHTRGFQNCDTVFDKVFADDEGHVKGFKYFSQFRKFGELDKVLHREIPGRETSVERILSYNIGLGIFDAFCACKIIGMLGID